MLSVTTDRLNLWRKSIQLFHKYRKTSGGNQFIGPFFAIGMNKYKIGPELLDNTGHSYTPDIVSSNRDIWLILELTNNDSSKMEKLIKYQGLKKEYLSSHGLIIPSGDNFVFSVRSHFIDDGPFCQIILNDKASVINIDKITSTPLKNALISIEGSALDSLPQIPITLLPESKGIEIRIGIVGQVIQLFDPLSSGKSSLDIVEEALERIKDKIPVTETRVLTEKVKREMDQLISGPLKGYAEYENGVYKIKKDIADSPKARMAAMNRVREWAGLGESIPKFGYQSTVFDFE